MEIGNNENEENIGMDRISSIFYEIQDVGQKIQRIINAIQSCESNRHIAFTAKLALHDVTYMTQLLCSLENFEDDMEFMDEETLNDFISRTKKSAKKIVASIDPLNESVSKCIEYIYKEMNKQKRRKEYLSILEKEWEALVRLYLNILIQLEMKIKQFYDIIEYFENNADIRSICEFIKNRYPKKELNEEFIKIRKHKIKFLYKKGIKIEIEEDHRYVKYR